MPHYRRLQMILGFVRVVRKHKGRERKEQTVVVWVVPRGQLWSCPLGISCITGKTLIWLGADLWGLPASLNPFRGRWNDSKEGIGKIGEQYKWDQQDSEKGPEICLVSFLKVKLMLNTSSSHMTFVFHRTAISDIQPLTASYEVIPSLPLWPHRATADGWRTCPYAPCGRTCTSLEPEARHSRTRPL